VSCLNHDKVAIVTGSSRGLGRAIVRELADHGCKVVINYFQSKEQAEQLLAELKDKGQEAIAVQAGVAHPDDVQSMIDMTVKEFGGIDILVNNAGVNRDRTIRRMSIEEWQEVIATDLSSVFYCTYAALPHMIERGGGRIVNMSSIVGQMGNPGQSNYAAAKAGIVGFTRAIAMDMASCGVTCNAYHPFAKTDLLGPQTRYTVEQRFRQGKIDREEFEWQSSPPGPEGVGPVIAYLASPAAAGITGKVFYVSGGKLAIYSEPVRRRTIHKAGAIWSVAELVERVPGLLEE